MNRQVSEKISELEKEIVDLRLEIFDLFSSNQTLVRMIKEQGQENRANECKTTDQHVEDC